MIRHLWLTLVVCTCAAVLCYTPMSHAAQAQPANQKEPENKPTDSSTNDPEPPKQADQKPASDSAKPAKDNEIFRPSEEISEDFAVSFPVDI